MSPASSRRFMQAGQDCCSDLNVTVSVAQKCVQMCATYHQRWGVPFTLSTCSVYMISDSRSSDMKKCKVQRLNMVLNCFASTRCLASRLVCLARRVCTGLS